MEPWANGLAGWISSELIAKDTCLNPAAANSGKHPNHRFRPPTQGLLLLAADRRKSRSKSARLAPVPPRSKSPVEIFEVSNERCPEGVSLFVVEEEMLNKQNTHRKL
jgi:hypothetical protein